MHGDKYTQNFQQFHYLLIKFFVRQVEHEIATYEQIDECHEREIWFVVTDKCAIYLLIEITWRSRHNIDAMKQMENCDSNMLQTRFSLISHLAMLKMFDKTFIRNIFLRFSG